MLDIMDGQVDLEFWEELVELGPEVGRDSASHLRPCFCFRSVGATENVDFSD